MRFTETKLCGAFVIEPEMLEDERGFFARTYCSEIFAAQGLCSSIAQCSISFNKYAGTLRGMHYQEPPKAEVKLVRCTMGTIYDVIIDLRPESATFREWLSLELSSSNRLMLYAPKGFAHGFQTLDDNTEVLYQISEHYSPEIARGVRWDDPVFGIKWPLPVVAITDKDRNYPYIELSNI